MAAPQRATPRLATPNRPAFSARAERREQLRLQRQQRTASPPRENNAAANQSQGRLEQLQSRRSQLSRSERREFRQLQRTQQATQNAQRDQVRLQQLQQQANDHRLGRADRRELRRLERAQQRQNPIAGADQLNQQRAARAQRVSPQQVTSGRFASNFLANNPARSDRRAARLAARSAWRLGLHAAFVPWHGPIYWPYAYSDIFYSTFWPDAYDLGYWAYAYDDFYDGIFFPEGAPYLAYAYEGPYGGAYARETTGSAYRRGGGTPGRMSQEARNFCAEQAKGVAAWPFQEIDRAVQPNAEQARLLDDLKKAANDAAEQFKEACPDAVPLTPLGRLQAMTARLEATLAAVKTVRPPLIAFYDSLNDEQKARFNEIGPELKRQSTVTAEQSANCGGPKAGISGLTIDRIEAMVQPTDAQQVALDRLDDAIQKSIDTLSKACPTAQAMTPVGRLDAMQQRLQAMIAAANEIRPALDSFYAALSSEQKAKFNRLGGETARSAD
jgi:hypothetical protein